VGVHGEGLHQARGEGGDTARFLTGHIKLSDGERCVTIETAERWGLSAPGNGRLQVPQRQRKKAPRLADIERIEFFKVWSKKLAFSVKRKKKQQRGQDAVFVQKKCGDRIFSYGSSEGAALSHSMQGYGEGRRASLRGSMTRSGSALPKCGLLYGRVGKSAQHRNLHEERL